MQHTTFTLFQLWYIVILFEHRYIIHPLCEYCLIIHHFGAGLSGATVPLLPYATPTGPSPCRSVSIEDCYELIHLMDTGRSQTLLRVPEWKSCPLKVFQCNPLIIEAVEFLLACQIRRHSGVKYGRRENPVPAAHALAAVMVCSTRYQSGDQSWYCTEPCIL